jgi:hypothetical protein
MLIKISCAACAIVAVLGGVFYFRSALPLSSPKPPVIPEQTTHALPDGALLIPHGDGLCGIRAIDNATGAIKDYGTTDCSKASDQNSAAWKRAMSKEVGIEVSKSFRHESDR